MNEQKQEEPKSRKLRYVAGILGIVIVAAIAINLVQPYGQVISRRSTNQQRATQTKLSAERKWAERLELPGVPNLHRVSEDLYRGAQPTAEGMQQLEKLGIKTVINLRAFHSDRDETTGTNLSYEHINMTTWHPEDDEVIRFLQIVTDKSRTPVFVHCQRGADRTGTMCAIYRIAVQGWSKSEAVEEMTKGGFGFYEGWQNLVDYIQNLDIEQIKRRLAANQ
ncbi:MAG: dual specificity protein phosphatase family protein [Planctomycetota bacterium]|nr:dual specificity protein phosphatase family protein [Planctomycetota bacterium]